MKKIVAIIWKFNENLFLWIWEVSLIFKYLVISVKTTVNFHHFDGQTCWLSGILKFALHSFLHFADSNAIMLQ